MIRTKVNFYLSKQPEEHVDFYVNHLTDKLRMIADELQQNNVIFGYRDSDIRPLKLDRVVHFYTNGGRVMAELDEQTYHVKQRVYQLVKRLPTKFIQISSGEIVNFDYVDHLEIVRNGTIKLVFTNHQVTFVSRRYVPKIKRRLGL